MLMRILWMLTSLAAIVDSLSSVTMPDSYTAMKGNIVVGYSLDANSTSFKGFNAMVHIEYLQGLDSDTLYLSSLPVPMGVTSGSVVFQCGLIVRAGPHRAVLTIDGEIEAISSILQVGWPPVSIRVPASLETYASRVEIVVAFATTICTPLMGGPEETIHPNSVMPHGRQRLFDTWLTLVECSKSLGYDDDEECQLNSKKIWYKSSIGHFLYQKSSFVHRLNCSVWGQEGTFALFLETNLKHAAVIERSAPIKVKTNREYHLESYSTTVFPCGKNDILPITLRRPKCAGKSDKVRVYGQGHHVVNGNFLLDDWHYLGEVRVQPEDDKIAVFPCELFHQASLPEKDRVTKFCFHYVSYSIIGTINTTSVFCLPAYSQDLVVKKATWSSWSPWSDCRPSTATNCDTKGQRSRHRFCSRDDPTRPTLLCQGKPVEYQKCSGSWSCSQRPSVTEKAHKATELQTSSWRPFSYEKSPCNCGCTYIVNGQRRVEITSGSHCTTLPLTWTIKASGKLLVDFQLISSDFSCGNSLLNVRQKGVEKGEEMIFQTNDDLTNGSLKTVAAQIRIEFMAPRRSCRLNIQVNARSTSLSLKVIERSDEEEDELQVSWILLSTLALILASVASCLCLMCQFEYRRQKYLTLKHLPAASSASTPSMNTCFEEVPPTPTRYQLHREKVKKALRTASNQIKEHWSGMSHSRKKRPSCSSLKRSLSDLGLSNAPDWWSSVATSRRPYITGLKVKRALKAKSRRYKRGHYRPQNRPQTPAASPLIVTKRFSCSLSDIISLLSLEEKAYSKCKDNDNDAISIDTLKAVEKQEGTISVRHKSSIESLVLAMPKAKRHRYLSATSASSSSSIVSLATLKNSISEYSQHSGIDVPELEYDLYDCDLNNVSAAPGSLFNPTVFFDLTPTMEEDELDELEMTELFPMLRRSCSSSNGNHPKRSDNAGRMVDSLTSDLAASMTSEDFRSEEAEKLLQPQIQPMLNLTSLTHIDDVTFVDE